MRPDEPAMISYTRPCKRTPTALPRTYPSRTRFLSRLKSINERTSGAVTGIVMGRLLRLRAQRAWPVLYPRPARLEQAQCSLPVPVPVPLPGPALTPAVDARLLNSDARRALGPNVGQRGRRRPRGRPKRRPRIFLVNGSSPWPAPQRLADVWNSAVLNLPKSASDHEVRERYRQLSIVFHPDKQVDEGRKAAATQRFLEVQKAYEGACVSYSLVSVRLRSFPAHSSLRSGYAVRPLLCGSSREPCSPPFSRAYDILGRPSLLLTAPH